MRTSPTSKLAGESSNTAKGLNASRTPEIKEFRNTYQTYSFSKIILVLANLKFSTDELTPDMSFVNGQIVPVAIEQLFSSMS